MLIEENPLQQWIQISIYVSGTYYFLHGLSSDSLDVDVIRMPTVANGRLSGEGSYRGVSMEVGP